MEIERVNPRSDSYSALLWDVVTNAHRYTPRPGDNVLDLGAHFGMFSLYAAARGAHVDAYEPQLEIYAELCHTAEVAAEIGYGDIVPHHSAVWTQAGFGTLTKINSTATASLVRVHGEQCGQVRTEAFDNVLSLHSEWGCVKCDVEGAEYELLRTSRELGRIGFLTIEIHNDILGSETCEEIRLILEKEFRHVTRLPNKNNPRETVAYFCRR